MSEQDRSECKKQNYVAALFANSSTPDCLRSDHQGEWSEYDKTRHLKQAVMQELLTGKTRLV